MYNKYIISTPEAICKKKIKSLVNKAALKHFLRLKENHSKLNETEYTEAKIKAVITLIKIKVSLFTTISSVFSIAQL